MDPNLHISPRQDLTARALLWLVALVTVLLVAYHYHGMRAAQDARDASVERMLDAPMVVYDKPYVEWILGHPLTIDRELAVPERTGR